MRHFVRQEVAVRVRILQLATGKTTHSETDDSPHLDGRRMKPVSQDSRKVLLGRHGLRRVDELRICRYGPGLEDGDTRRVKSESGVQGKAHEEKEENS